MRRVSLGQLAILSVLLLVGLALRAVGYDWGAPLLLHPDEFAVAASAQGMHERGSLDPDFFMRPNHVSIYASAAAYGVVSHVAFDKPAAEAYRERRLFFHHLSRLICALFGVLGIVAAYLVGRHFHAHVGLYAGAAVALFPSYVKNAHYASPDVPLTTLTTFTIAATLSYVKVPRRRTLAVSCALAALCFIEKYPGLLTCTALGAAIFWVHRGEWRLALRESVIAALLFVVFLFCFSPYLVLRSGAAWRALMRESKVSHAGEHGFDWPGNASYYLDDLVHNGGWLLVALAVLGAVHAFRTYRALLGPVLVGAVYWLALSRLGVRWDRWALPMHLTPLLLAALGAHWTVSQTTRGGAWYRRALCALLLGSVAFRLSTASALVSTELTFRETRVEALAFARSQGITRRNSLFEGYTPFLLHKFHHRAFPLHELPPGKRYLVLSSFTFDRYYQDPEHHQQTVAWYESARKLPLVRSIGPGCPAPAHLEWLGRAGTLLHMWKHHDRCLTGPTVEFYRLTPTSTSAAADERGTKRIVSAADAQVAD